MCEQTEINYLDGDIVWVKLGSCWWPGEVVGPERLPPDVLPSFRKPPIAVVKFFQESSYEYVKNINFIYKYNCSKKNEFINKGLYMYRSKHAHMEKFPEDVIRAETAVGGDQEILTREEFQEQKKPSYAGLFGDTPKKTPTSGTKRGRGRPSSASPKVSTPTKKFYKEKSDYQVHYLLQGSKESQRRSTDSTPSTSRAGSEPAEEKTTMASTTVTLTATPSASGGGIYSCPTCSFTTSRLNVLVLHNKTHSATYLPYTPSPTRKKPITKSPTKSVSKSATKASKSAKTPRPRKEKTESTKKSSKKRAAEESKPTEAKKPKTDQEIKSSLLADWDDDVEEDSNDESSAVAMSGSPEIPIGAESPAVPTPAELPTAQVPEESPEKKSDEATEKVESSSDSKYEFCEDEDWAVEADAGRKIPRVKNPSKRKDETKSLSIDEDDVVKEVAELLNKTSVPELPSIPEPVKAEENFPDPPVIKSPDKKSEPNSSGKTEIKPTKAIFKTKTFFRSRHSRSQDVIGKYVAEQLNAAERLDMADSDLNGSENVSSPEARESPPVEPVRVTRMAPKMQLKKMKAEAEQREKEKSIELAKKDEMPVNNTNVSKERDMSQIITTEPPKDVLYPTQEIKPINKEVTDKLSVVASKQESTTPKSVKTTTDIDSFESTIKLNKEKNESGETTNDNNALQFNLEQRDIEKTSEDNFDSKQKLEHLENEQGCNIITSRSDFRSIKEFSIDTHSHSVTEKSEEHNFVTKSPENSNYYGHLPELDDKFTNKSNLLERKHKQIEISSVEDAFPKESIDQPRPNPQKNDSNAKLPKSESLVSKAYSELIQPYMNESTASAVDALLSVSRETDRVPKIVSKDLPEDLFEDDNKEAVMEENVSEVNVTINNMQNEKYPLSYVENDIAKESSNLNTSLSTDDMQTSLNKQTPEKSNEDVLDTLNIEVKETTPSESDLQIAETLLNLPATAMQNNTSNEHHDSNSSTCTQNQNVNEVNDDKMKTDSELVYNTETTLTMTTSNNDNLNIRYETEQEKSENLNAAESLVQMSESVEHKMNVVEAQEDRKNITKIESVKTSKNGMDTNTNVDTKITSLSNDNKNENLPIKTSKVETPSKLLKILEEPSHVKTHVVKSSPMKQVIIAPKEKILNFDVAKSPLKAISQPTKKKIFIRRGPPSKTIINNLNDVVASPENIILSRNNTSQDGSSIQTFTIQASTEIQTSNDPKQIIIQPKFRKVTKQTKLQKIKPQNSLIVPMTEKPQLNQMTTNEDQMFDINSMPVVLSEDILTPESIDKMPIVMSDGNIISSNTSNVSNPPKLIKTKPTIIDNEKITINKVQQDVVAISPVSEKIAISTVSNKPEVKTLLINTSSDGQKTTPPNILSKSSKLRGGKPMLVIDKATGKQKIIMTKAEPCSKEVKPPVTIIQSAPQPTSKTEKFIILPATNSPRPRTQKIVIDPQTGKACVLVAKGQDPPVITPENKPVSAKIVPSSSDASTPGNTVMIITNAQGAQSRIVLTPEHEKILFPNKQQPNVSQLKAITQRISTTPKIVQKTIVTSTPTTKTQTRIVPKQKSAIITSKGQLIVGGRVATTAQNIAPMPEVRPAPKRIIAAEPKKLVQTIQKTSSEPLIFLQQKSGAVMQLTAAQFEHLQRTGQIIQKTVAPVQENKVVVQKSVTINPKETIIAPAKQRVRKIATEGTTPLKKLKQEVATTPSPKISLAPVPPLTSLSAPAPAPAPSPAPAPIVTISSIIPTVSNTASVTTTQSFANLENFEELLPSTAIAKQVEYTPIMPAPEPQVIVPQPAPPAPEPVPELQPQLADGQLLAVPGENFGGPAGSFYLCVEENGTYTPIDNRPLILENNQLVPMTVEQVPVFCPQPERRDILEAALANSDVFHADTPHDEAPDFRDLNANVSVHCRVSETSTTLNQPIMTPVEVPSKCESEPAVPSTLEDGLAVIGVTPHSVPTSLELPITVTDPRIAPKTTDPLSNSNYGTTLMGSPRELRLEERGAGGSMPLLTDEDAVGKSMPILTDEVGGSSVESVGSQSLGSPTCPDEDAPRRLLTPCSDTSETSVEIPFQPTLQLSVNDLSRHV